MLSKWWRQKSWFDAPPFHIFNERNVKCQRDLRWMSADIFWIRESFPWKQLKVTWIFFKPTLPRILYSYRTSPKEERKRKHFLIIYVSFSLLCLVDFFEVQKLFCLGWWWWLSLIRTFICSLKRNSKQEQKYDGKHFKVSWREFITKENFLFYLKHELRFISIALGESLLSSCLRIHSD